MLKLLLILVVALVGCHEARNIRKTQKRNVETCKIEDINAVDVELSQLTGVWFKVLHKYTPSSGRTSYTLKNELDGDKLSMSEYYLKEDGTCGGPITGEWTKPETGKIHLKATIEGETHETTATIVYHYKHPNIDKEEIIAIYACKRPSDDGTCSEDQQIGAILSKTRAPLTSSLFYAAQALNEACLNPKTLTKLNTFSSCGNELLDDEQKEEGEGLEEGDTSSSSEEEETETYDRCNVDNIQGIEINLDDLPVPSKYYMIAAYDGYLTQQGITMMNFEYKGEKIGDDKIKTYMKLLKHGVCYEAELEEWVDAEDSSIWRAKSTVKTPAGPLTIETPMKMIYSKHGVFIAHWCKERDPIATGRCKTPQVAIFSKQPRLRLSQYTLAALKLASICVDPRKMIFMSPSVEDDCSSFYNLATHEHDHAAIADEDKCKVSSIKGTDHFELSKLEGVWYVAAGIGVESLHPHLRSGVLKRTATDDPNVLNTEAYINLRDGSCIQVTGTVKLISAEDATVEHDITATINGEERNIKQQHKVLHAGSQLVIFYHCQEENSDGTCKAPIIRLDSRTREIRHRDIQNIQGHAVTVCAEPDSISWFFMHSQCGKELERPFGSRHDYLALSHADTLDLITKFATPMCQVSDIKGQDISLEKQAKVGPWYSVAMYDAKWMDFPLYGSISKLQFTGDGTAFGVEQAVYDAGDGKTCHEITYEVYKEPGDDPNDVKYLGKFSFAGTEYNLHWRWVWSNYRINIGYSCRRPARDGTCPTDQVSVFVMANHETINHAEWLLVENVVRNLCVDPALLKHFTGLEICMIRSADQGNVQYPPRDSCDWDTFKGLPFTPEDAEGNYHTMAFASRTSLGAGLKSRSYKMEKQDDDNIKLTMKSTYEGSAECESKELILTRGDSETNEWKTTFDIDGTETPVSIWLGHSAGPYTVLIGCTGDDCNEETGFVFIESHYRANDRIAIHKTYSYLQDNCINPDLLSHLDSHNLCGEEIDTRTCKVADFQGLDSYNDGGFSGIWYLVVHTNERYQSLKCKTDPGDAADGEVKVTCYAQMGGQCFGPSEGEFTRDADKPGQVTYSYSRGPMKVSQDYHLLYQDDNFLLMVGCKRQNQDGSCINSRTNSMIWSKQSSTTHAELPEGLLEKLDEVCVHTSDLGYLSVTECGTELVDSFWF